jgi:hypothetical protein
MNTLQRLLNEIEDMRMVENMLESSVAKMTKLDRPITLAYVTVDDEFLVKVLSALAAGIASAIGQIVEFGGES